MKLEEWRDIPDYPNYQVSNLGNVKSKERLLKQQIDKKGYHYVRLYNKNGWKYCKVHRLVAQAFIPNINNEPTVDHKDRNKDNNISNNLRWASHIVQANNKDKTKIIENMKIVGKKPYKNRSEKVKQYDLENNFIKEWSSSREASKTLNISETAISNCVNSISKKAGGYMEALEPNMYVRLNCNYELGIGKTIGEIDEDNFIKTKFKDGFECSLPTYMIKKIKS